MAVYVQPVQVLPVDVSPEHPVVDAVGVQHRDHYEVEILPKQVSSVVLLVQ